MSEQRAALNTDREIWRESENGPSIHVTEGGGIGINVGGHVIVLPVREWFGVVAKTRTFALPVPAPAEYTCPRCGSNVSTHICMGEPVAGETNVTCQHCQTAFYSANTQLAKCPKCKRTLALFHAPSVAVSEGEAKPKCANCDATISKENDYTFPCGDWYCWHCHLNRSRHEGCDKCAAAAKSWFALLATPPTNPVSTAGMTAEFDRFLTSFASSFAGHLSEESEFMAKEAFGWAWRAAHVLAEKGK